MELDEWDDVYPLSTASPQEEVWFLHQHREDVASRQRERHMTQEQVHLEGQDRQETSESHVSLISHILR